MKKFFWKAVLMTCTFGFAVWLLFLPYLAFGYYSHYSVARDDLRFFFYYSFIVMPSLLALFSLALTYGSWRGIVRHLRILIVLTAIFFSTSFTTIKWIDTVNSYGVYGHYSKVAEDSESFLRAAVAKQDSTAFENETAYRESMKHLYDLAFKKIWTFDAIVFLSAFLLLQVVPRRNKFTENGSL